MFNTEICKLFNIKYPIILGGMLWIGKAELTAAVSDAGGLGLLGAGGMQLEEIKEELEKVKKLTDKPFGVNIPLVRPDSEEMINISIESGATVIATSSGSPNKFTSHIQSHGAKVIQVVSNVKFAKKSEDAGVDAIAVEGFEAGGHNGHDEITTMALVPQVSSAVKVPVIAAGGIFDGRGMIAALALGAKGIQLGTRFLATKEATVHDNYKEAVVKMGDNGTCVTGRTTIGPTRAIKNDLTSMILMAENEGKTSEELFELIGEGRSAMACLEGDTEEGSMYCGQIGGAIKEIVTVKQVVDEMIAQAVDVTKSVNNYL